MAPALPNDPALDRFRRDPTVVADDDPLSRFLALACLTYGQEDGPARWSAAGDVLRAHPDLPEQNLYAAAAVGDPSAVRAHLADRPEGARSLGGPFRWTALFHLAAARVPQRDPAAAARLLLDAQFDGRTLLHHAAWIGDVELVQALLECGAAPDVRDAEYGNTPLGWAEHGHAEATAALLRAWTPREARRRT